MSIKFSTMMFGPQIIGNDTSIEWIKYVINNAQYSSSTSFNFVAPSGCFHIYAAIQGAGGGGAGDESHGSDRYPGGSGGSGGFVFCRYDVIPGTSYYCQIGAGGAIGPWDGSGGNGGATSFIGLALTGGGGGIRYDSGAGAGSGGTVPTVGGNVLFSQAGSAGLSGGKWVTRGYTASWISTNMGWTYGRGGKTGINVGNNSAGDSGAIWILTDW